MKTISRFICITTLALCTFSTANATILINEIDYDQDGIDTAEFIELFNPGSSSIDLNGYRLDLINGSTTTTSIYRSFDLTGYSLAADGFFVICNNASTVMNCNFDAGIPKNMIQNGSSDGVALFNGSDLIDAMTYEGTIAGITEGSNGALDDKNSGILSIGRLLNSQDTNNNATDFERGCITPGTVNISGNGNCSITTASTVSLPSIIWLFVSGFIGMRRNTKPN